MTTDAKQQRQQKELTGSEWQQYGKELHRYLARCLRHHNQQYARDLAQEVYLRLLRVEKGEPIRNYQAYLYRIASHVIYEFKMRARREIVTYDSSAVEAWGEDGQPSSADPIGEQVGTERQVARVLEQLPPISRMVLLLQKRDGLEYTEVAQALGISVNMVHKHLTRALATLRATIWDLKE